MNRWLAALIIVLGVAGNASAQSASDSDSPSRRPVILEAAAGLGTGDVGLGARVAVSAMYWPSPVGFGLEGSWFGQAALFDRSSSAVTLAAALGWHPAPGWIVTASAGYAGVGRSKDQLCFDFSDSCDRGTIASQNGYALALGAGYLHAWRHVELGPLLRVDWADSFRDRAAGKQLLATLNLVFGWRSESAASR